MVPLEEKNISEAYYKDRYKSLLAHYRDVISRRNKVSDRWNGIYERYEYPVLTEAHVPLSWRYDLDPESNPYLMERMGINSVFNPGAIKVDDKYLLIARVEGKNRKSFFAVAESSHPVEGFEFWEEPILMPETSDPDTNVYDMRLTRHEDGWIYGIFCTERKDISAGESDTSSAVAQAGISRTHDLKNWERLPDLETPSAQQRNVVLHPEFVHGNYAFYTRPQDEFIKTGKGGGIGWALVKDIEKPVARDEIIIDPKIYHTVKEVKNGQGPPPIKTDEGWLHLAHGVRGTAAGLRYVLYLFMTELDQPWKIIHMPGDYLMAPIGSERVGDVSNVLFCSGWIRDDDDSVYIYYGSSDTRIHVASTSVDRLIDFARNTPPDAYYSAATVKDRLKLIRKNKSRSDGGGRQLNDG